MTKDTKPTKKRGDKAPEPPPASGPNVMQLKREPEKSDARLLADLTTEGLFTSAVLLKTFSANVAGEIGITEAVHSLKASLADVNRGDLRSVETMLLGQAAALNAIFAEMARRSGINMGQYMDAAERYMRLALKAQGQCRATLETLAAIKNPPLVFARQANINNGGQQQVNNGPGRRGFETNTRGTRRRGRARGRIAFRAKQTIGGYRCRTAGHRSAKRGRRSSSRRGDPGSGQQDRRLRQVRKPSRAMRGRAETAGCCGSWLKPSRLNVRCWRPCDAHWPLVRRADFCAKPRRRTAWHFSATVSGGMSEVDGFRNRRNQERRPGRPLVFW